MADMNKIDEAIQKAKAAQKAKMSKVETNSSEPKQPKAKAEKMTDEEKKARTLARAKELADKKTAREQAKAEKVRARAEEKARKAEERAAKKLSKAVDRLKSESRGPAHMKKVEKAAGKLPALTESLSDEVQTLVSKYSVQELSRLIAHLAHSNRVQSTLNSGKFAAQLNVGDTVRIVSCENDPGVIDRVGTITEVRKIRVLVNVPGHTRDVYLFNSDCEVTESGATADVNEEVETPAVDEDDTNTDVEGVSVDEETSFLTITDEEESTGTGTEG